MNWLDVILSITTALLGGTSIWQFATLKSIKRSKKAEADALDIKNFQDIINGQASEIQRLHSQVDQLYARIAELEKRVCFASDCKNRM